MRRGEPFDQLRLEAFAAGLRAASDERLEARTVFASRGRRRPARRAASPRTITHTRVGASTGSRQRALDARLAARRASRRVPNLAYTAQSAATSGSSPSSALARERGLVVAVKRVGASDDASCERSRPRRVARVPRGVRGAAAPARAFVTPERDGVAGRAARASARVPRATRRLGVAARNGSRDAFGFAASSYAAVVSPRSSAKRAPHTSAPE